MRRVKSRMIWIVSAAFAGIGCVALPAAAQDEDVVVDVRFAGLANVTPHEKDADAYRALMMLGERLADIPGEVGGPDEARAGIELLWDLFRGAHALRIDRTQNPPGLGFAFTLTPEVPMNGQTYLEKFASFAESTGGPIREAPEGDGYLMSTPIGDASFQSGEVMGKSSVVVLLGATEPAQTNPMNYGLPRDASAVFSARIHLQRLGQFVLQIIDEEQPEMAEAIEEFRWIIDEAPLLDISYGTTALSGEHQMLASRMHNAKAWLTKLGMDPSHTFTREQFADIPQDATLVSAFPFELGFVLKLIDWAAEQEGEDPFGEAEEMLGFDVRGDVLENVGPRVMYYQSDSTGGGGLLSSVLIAELRDPARLAEVHAELIERFNAFAGEQARGYIRIRPWEASGHDVFSLATPGLPVPIEVSWAIVDNRLVVAASPVGIVSAIAQMTGDGPSINDNAKFASAILDYLPENGAASATFSDTERFAKLGYGGTNLLLSGLANAVRSPSDPAREAGVIMPEFGAFASGIKPMGAIEYWDGDDYVAVMRLDGSTVVEIAEMLGQFGGGQAVAAMAAMQVGVAIPAIERSRVTAKQMVSASQVRALVQATIVYSSDNNGKFPESYEELIKIGYISPEMLVSSAGPAWDEQGDIVLRFGIDPALANSFRANVVVAMDRAAYVNGGMDVNVGFTDGHVETLSHWEVDELLEEPDNQGARAEFMLGE